MRRSNLDFVLLGNDYSQYFVKKVSQILDKKGSLKFATGHITSDSYPAGHRFAQLDENVRRNEVVVLHSYLVDQPAISDMDLFMIADALKRSSCSNYTLCTTFTEFRLDKKIDGRVAIYAKLFADLLQKAAGPKFERFVTSHAHSEQVQGFFDVSVDTLPSLDIFEYYCQKILFPKLGIKNPFQEVIVYGGDGGSVPINRRLARRLSTPYLSGDKLRSIKEEGNISASDGAASPTLISDRLVLSLDDICCSGGTLCNTAQNVLNCGARDVCALITHGLFSTKKGIPASKRIRQVEKLKIITTDTIPRDENYFTRNQDWLIAQISLAPVYAEALEKTFLGQSVSDLFRDSWDKRYNSDIKKEFLEQLDRSFQNPLYLKNQ